MTALIIAAGTLGLGIGGLVGVTVGEDHGQAVGYSSLALFAIGLFTFGFGLAQVLT